MRLIDADALKQTFCAECVRTQCENCNIDYHFNHAPTVDAVPVVRCKDCKYADENAKCRFVSWYNKKDDFCSRGERREDAETD